MNNITETNKSRRDFVRTMGAAGAVAAGAMLASHELSAQYVNKSTAKGGRIDVHHHHVPPGGAGGGRGPGGRGPWTAEKTLEQMDKFDIAASVLSMTQNGDVLYDNTEKGRAAVRAGNEFGAKLVQQYPKRFGLFTGVPLPDLDGAMKEITYGFDTLKADGIGIYTNDNQTRWPGDPYFDPMWQELNRRNAVVYMHPLAPPCCTKLNDSVPVSMNEYDFDITRACTSILVNGVLHKYPNVKIIIPHSGGTMPMIAGRIKDRYPHNPKTEEYIPNGVIAELQKFYLDIAHASFPYPMAAAMKFAKPDHMLFGTDYPFEPIESTVNELPGLGLSAATMRAIERDNAEKILPRFKGMTRG
ncbi:MAG: amidohydrolase family protein [Bryobacteraceae bacterium]